MNHFYLNKKYFPFIIIFCFFFIANTVIANYITPGNGKSWNLDSLVANSSGNVTFSSGVYYINDTLTVSQSDTIKIYSNAIIKLSALVLLDIQGILKISPPDSVLFTALDTTQMYLGMRFDSLSDASVLKKVIMEWGNAIKLINCDMIIDSCILRNNKQQGNFSGTVGGVINLFKSNPVISNCNIYHNRRAAIISSFNIPSSPQIINNIFFENCTDNYNTPQINLGAAGNQTVFIRNNIIIGLTSLSGGISIYPGGSVQLAIIENNIIKKNRYGIALYGSNLNAIIRNNIIDSNNVQGDPYLGGSGINFNGKSSLIAKVSKNIIRGNLWGITIQDSAKPSFGNILSPDTNDAGLNQIYGNYHNDTIPDLYNNTHDSIKAENNYWGTTNLDSIENHIFHKPDNPLLGFVDYLPIRNSTNIIVNNIISENYLLNIYPNPFNSTERIDFSIPNRGYYQLGIYDILGRLISILKGGEFLPGKYNLLWDAGKLPGGIYYCRFSGSDFTKTMKLVLIK